MKIFLITDNLWWFNKASLLFKEKMVNIKFFCSPSSTDLFEQELNNSLISTLDVKTNVEYLIQNFSFGISAHCKQIFPSPLVESLRCVNIHPGLNPFNRGWYPQVFSILNKKPAGATIHIMDKEIDHGEILAQEEVQIYEWDTSKTAYDRILEKEYQLLIDNFESIIDDSIYRTKPHGIGNYNSIQDYKNLQPIDLNKTVTMGEAIDFLRAMTHPPYKNAFFITKDDKKVYVTLNLEEH